MQVSTLDAALHGQDARSSAQQRAVAAEVSELRKSNLSLREERRKAREDKARLDSEVAALKVLA